MNTQITAETAKFQLKQVNIGDNYVLLFGNNGGKTKDKPTLAFGKVLSSGKNKGQIKKYWAYYYNSEESRQEKALSTYNNVKDNIESEVQKKQAMKDKLNDFNMSDLVGRVFYSSWGYDQTNVDFYQVVGITKRMAVVRKISSIVVEGSVGMMCCHVKPDINNFMGGEEKKLIKVHAFGLIICNGRYSLSEYKGGEKGTYCSWYA